MFVRVNLTTEYNFFSEIFKITIDNRPIVETAKKKATKNDEE